MYHWNDKIESVQGVGPSSARLLKRLKIHTVGDLLEHKPRGYYLPTITDICSVKSGRHEIIRGRVVRVNRQHAHTNFSGVVVDDGTGHMECRWYNRFDPYGLGGETITFFGKVKNRVMSQPSVERFCDINVIAGGYYGKHSQTIRRALTAVFHDMDPFVSYWWNNVYRRMHFPMSHQEYSKVIDRLKHMELLLLHMAMEARRDKSEIREPIYEDDTALDYFPYPFTDDQNDTIHDALTDIASGRTMNRLIHGEVGTGKTSVAFYVAISLALKGHSSLIVAPTTILAQQHYNTLTGLGWDDCSLHVGTFKKTKVGKIAIGTHTLLGKGWWHNYRGDPPALVVVDEQHKFGVAQRSLLKEYGNPHILQMSATPIPRSLCMTVFGDTDLSIIKQSPVNRGPVVTRWILPEKRGWMYNIVEHHLLLGHQAYIVYPRIGESDDMESVVAGCSKIRKRFGGKSFTIGVLTGIMDRDMKDQQLKAFKSGEYDILISTVIAEVGLDNQNATVMVIEGADRFGLSQLHQLRGRVCRSKSTAFCFLVAETENDTSIARLDVMEKTNDGFKVAEQDLRLRGPGGMFSFRQHGIPELKFADLVDDFKLMMQTKVEAHDWMSHCKIDSRILEMLTEKYGDVLQLGGV